MGIKGQNSNNSSVPGFSDSARNDSARARARRGGYSGASTDVSKGSIGQDSNEGAILTVDDAPQVGPEYTYRKTRLHRSDDIDIYAEKRDAQTKMPRQKRTIIVLAVTLVIVYVLAVVLPPEIFTSNMAGTTLAGWLSILINRTADFASYLTFQGTYINMDWVANRYMIVGLAGAALAISGAVYQGSLSNALASPSTLGVMTGANVGRMVYAIFFYSSAYAGVYGAMQMSEVSAYLDSLSTFDLLFTEYGQAFCSLIGSAVVVVTVLLVAQVSSKKELSNVVMVIAGQVMATLLGAIMSLIQYYYTLTGNDITEIMRQMQTQAFTLTFTQTDLMMVGIPVVICIVIILALTSRLNLLAFSNDEARSMGMDTTHLRWIMVGTCTVLTAVVVAFCGQVGMVGFFVPHMVRKMVGPNFKYLVPASALTGALFLIVVYCALSMFGSGVATNMGVFTSLFGSLIFLYIAITRRGDTSGDWK